MSFIAFFFTAQSGPGSCTALSFHVSLVPFNSECAQPYFVYLTLAVLKITGRLFHSMFFSLGLVCRPRVLNLLLNNNPMGAELTDSSCRRSRGAAVAQGDGSSR